MTKRLSLERIMILLAGITAVTVTLPACTEEEARAVLAGVQVVAEELDSSDDVSFRDWLSSELDD